MAWLSGMGVLGFVIACISVPTAFSVSNPADLLFHAVAYSVVLTGPGAIVLLFTSTDFEFLSVLGIEIVCVFLLWTWASEVPLFSRMAPFAAAIWVAIGTFALIAVVAAGY